MAVSRLEETSIGVCLACDVQMNTSTVDGQPGEKQQAVHAILQRLSHKRFLTVPDTLLPNTLPLLLSRRGLVRLSL